MGVREIIVDTIQTLSRMNSAFLLVFGSVSVSPRYTTPVLYPKVTPARLACHLTCKNTKSLQHNIVINNVSSLLYALRMYDV